MQKTLSLLIVAAATVSLTSGCRTFGKRGAADQKPVDAAGVKAPASAVGTDGSYKEFVIPDDGGDKAYAIESDGLRGSTGRHVSAPAPEPEPKLVVPAAPAGADYYVVQDGDILGRIANKHGVSVKALVEANGLKDASKIRVGQKLKIPAASAAPKAASAKKASGAAAKKASSLPAKEGCTVYVVQNGDILGRVAKKHGVTMKAIREANGMTTDKLYAGKAIYIPAASAAPVKAVEAKPAAPVAPEVKPLPPAPKEVEVPAAPEVKPVEAPAAPLPPAVEPVTVSEPVEPADVEPAEDFLSTLD